MLAGPGAHLDMLFDHRFCPLVGQQLADIFTRSDHTMTSAVGSCRRETTQQARAYHSSLLVRIGRLAAGRRRSMAGQSLLVV